MQKLRNRSILSAIVIYSFLLSLSGLCYEADTKGNIFDGRVSDSVHIHDVEISKDELIHSGFHVDKIADTYYEESGDIPGWYTLEFSTRDEEQTLIRFSKGHVYVQGHTTKNRSGWSVKIYNDATGVVVLNGYGTIDNNGDFFKGFSFDLPIEEEQDYKISIYFKEENDVYYWTQYYGLPLSKTTDNILYFERTDIYEHNQNMRKSNADADPENYLKVSTTDLNERNELVSLVESITGGLTENSQKAIAIHDWIAENIFYDWDSYENGEYPPSEAYSVYVSKKSVCAGYANLTSELMRIAGIPARSVNGHSIWTSSQKWSDVNHDKSDHAWNEIYIDGEWKIVDVTWDSKNRFEDGQFIKKNFDYAYYMPSVNFFSMNHKINWIENNEDQILQDPVYLYNFETDHIRNEGLIDIPVKMIAKTIGGISPEYQFWIRKPNSGWEVYQDYSNDNEAEYTPDTSGLYKIAVRVKERGSNDYQEIQINYSVNTGQLTRSDWVVLISDIMGVKEEATAFGIPADINDVEASDWFASYVWYSYYQGWLELDEYGNINPDGPVEANAFCKYILKSQGIDVDPIDQSVEKLSELGFDIEFANGNAITREEALNTIKICEHIEISEPIILEGIEIVDNEDGYVNENTAVRVNVLNDSGVQYRFWIMEPGGQWKVVQEYSEMKSLNFTPSKVGAYKIGVWVKREVEETHLTAIMDYSVISVATTLSLDALSTDKGTSGNVGEEVFITATTSNGSGVQYKFWVMEPGGVWEIKQDFSITRTFSFTPNKVGAYKFGVWVIDDNNKEHQVEIIDYTAIGVVADPVKLNGLKTNMTGNTSEAGQAVTLSADITGGSNVQYQYWVMQPGGAWEIGQSYTSTESYNYTPKAPGTYKFGVWVIDDNNKTYQVEIIDYTVTGVAADPVKLNGLNTNKTGNTSEAGQAVTLSADITGGSNVQYQYWVMQPGGAWEIGQSYASTESYNYTPKAPGTYKFGVWVIDDNNKTYQVEIIDYTVTGVEADPVKLNGLNTDKTGNTSETGQVVSLSADITGGSNVQYQYWVMQPGGAWEIGQSYASTETFAYTPKAPGAYKFGIWVIDDNNTSYQVEIIDYTVTGEVAEPVKLNSLSTNMIGNTGAKDTEVKLVADITGGSNVEYQYWVMLPGGVWEIAQVYSSADTYTYTPRVAGVYQFGIWVIDDNNKTHQIDIINYTVTEQLGDVLQEEVKMSADKIAVEESAVEKIPAVEEYQEELIIEEPVVEEMPASEDALEEVVEEPLVEEKRAAEETLEEASFEELTEEEIPASEKVQEETVEENLLIEEKRVEEETLEEASFEELTEEEIPVVEEVPAVEETFKEAIVEDPAVEKIPSAENVQEEAVEENSVVEEKPTIEETQEGATTEESVVEEGFLEE